MAVEFIIGNKGGIPWCINCCGMHPDAAPNIMECVTKMTDPGKDAMMQWKAYQSKKAVYANKSCAMCGRTYKANGECDDSYELTAKRVKEEFDNAGVFGVSDGDVKLVVADCRKTFMKLLAHRLEIHPSMWEQFTFSGRLALIISQAQNARHSKMNYGKGLE